MKGVFRGCPLHRRDYCYDRYHYQYYVHIQFENHTHESHPQFNKNNPVLGSQSYVFRFPIHNLFVTPRHHSTHLCHLGKVQVVHDSLRWSKQQAERLDFAKDCAEGSEIHNEHSQKTWISTTIYRYVLINLPV